MGTIILSVTDVTKKFYNSGSVYPVVMKMVSKCAQDMKEKSHQVSANFLFALRSYREKCRGGGWLRPPPPAFLGLSNIDCFAHFITLLIALLIWATLLYTSISFSVSSTIHECFQSSTCLPIVISLQALHIIFKLWRKLFFF